MWENSYFENQVNSPSLEDIFFSSEKGSPSMWLQTRSWNVFSLSNGTSWKIFCLLPSSEPPWGHPSHRAPAQKDSLIRYFRSTEPAFCSAEEDILKHLGIDSWLYQGDSWERPRRFVHKEKSMNGIATDWGALSEPFGYAASENEPGHGSCKRKL